MFCQLIQKKANVVFEDEKVFAMLSPEPFVNGHLMVLPKQHFPIMEVVPDFVVGHLFGIANKMSILLLEALGAHGINLLIQNGPFAGQRHNHVILHVIPRFEKDNLAIGWAPKPADEELLSSLEGKIKDETKNTGIFEQEKQKPIEQLNPAEIKEDYRTGFLRRIP